ncbi:type I methionyl aminopeptidase [Liquorilactobacillus satsumensis]|uniref:Methionine aminopeptidase n=2 Tax=Liquorilactobacillus satsumensis TaxID=259059 RepID=A0A0R1UZR3_9LACO|nr:type I methionyl aminopeptidase [Liquorilactobacillus satsumensis]KRL98831.1 methionine aminopeptidase [Liquorilactobacillus satsumensis DSM 16230 = JCM 12392]MCC7666337.1 type I methionyl aminopeptidase [Liquorilactobacillus satsumensis]MCP9312745.1 type I methionyl aminopeptidase [Liquorilactobacillus satsumensis]MCP9327989.1 type I methionyl aminopeptidase [Liquorilactobacillus satsumensis]MCP9358477.1 type I methionyl aminopeptidase [Liquorilactobacillus satsumensis]
MITLKSAREIAGMNKSGAILAAAHRMLRDKIVVGMDTWEIEQLVDNFIQAHGATASEKGVDGYKYATCISINDEVAHAIPRKGLKLKNHDVVTVDFCVNWQGYQSDSAWTYVVGESTPEIERLLAVTHKALYLGIEQAQVGNRVGDIGYAIQNYVENQAHMGDVRELIGHGIGPSVHEEPDIFHYGRPHHGLRLRAGMVITIEPMVNAGGSSHIETKVMPKIDWEYYVSADRSLAAQFEHTLAITATGPKILTSQDNVFDQKYLL